MRLFKKSYEVFREKDMRFWGCIFLLVEVILVTTLRKQSKNYELQKYELQNYEFSEN